MVYHYTKRKSLDSIRRKGLLVGQKANYTSNFFVDNLKIAYGMVPIFCFTNKQNTTYNLDGDSVLLGIDEKNLKIGADIGSLVDHGAYLEDNGFWFSKDIFEDFYDEKGELSYDLLINSSLFIKKAVQMTGTLVILENITPDKIHILQ